MGDEEQGKDSNQPSMSSGEAASAEPAHDDDDAGSSCRRRPYYECTFCRRGFSNAQALGGHMNIHRKDRARPRLPPPPLLPAITEKKTTPTSQQKPHELSLFGADLRLGLGSGHVGGSVVVADEGRREEEGGGGALDLELRLGQQP